MKHWATATIESIGDDPVEFANDLSYQMAKMAIKIMEDAEAAGSLFDKADIELVIDLHG